MLDERLLSDYAITIHHFFCSVGFGDIPMSGHQLDGVFIIIRDVNSVHMQILISVRKGMSRLELAFNAYLNSMCS